MKYIALTDFKLGDLMLQINKAVDKGMTLHSIDRFNGVGFVAIMEENDGK